MTRAAGGWRVPLALVALVALPLGAGSLRVVEILGGPRLLPDNPRVHAVPVPLVLHVVAAAVYAVLGAFQLSSRQRRAHPDRHRRNGRAAVVAGAVVALSGVWMTLFYPDAPGGVLLQVVRFVVGTAVAAGVVLGVTAVRRRDIPAHRAWMIRAYALAVAAGTQTFTQGIGNALFGTGDLSTALSLTAGWVLNAVVAEIVIRRPRPGRTTAVAVLGDAPGDTVGVRTR
ncbi:DUF2306 domain-containing protein [Kineosporia sp. A_224]|uniref:DUF2306 domain-containing protein n=1 Tax=Kineosporia sp. A_224 TaxID=1962180 RepID=UPI000B4B17C4|nr:DUF2306 domain-containing protein [Kineosporia sp. A_224]